jgi:putative methyltransferase (TIGR04325 family)
MLKKIIKDFMPPAFLRSITGLFYGWHGNYPEWNIALRKCSGYDSQLIIDKVKESSLKVKMGLAKYERDSVIFNEIQYNFPVLSSLLWVASRNNGKLNVLDFGGSLGSCYYQHKFFLDSFAELKWCIVEQPNFVKVGLESFSDARLKFYNSIDECLNENNINVILLSSVISYLEKPYELLDSLKSKKIKYILFDKTPLIKGNDRITIQKAKPAIYKASYPSWFFNKRKFIDFMETEYELIFEFDSDCKANIPSEFKGFLFNLKNSSV